MTTNIRSNCIPREVFPACEDFASKQNLTKQFKIGDVIFTRYRGRFKFTLHHIIDTLIITSQKITCLFHKQRDEDKGHRMTHAGIVVGVDEVYGKVLVAEAFRKGRKNEMQTCDFFTEYLLKRHSPWEYDIVRMDPNQSEVLPKIAAEIAQSLAARSPAVLEGRSHFTQETKGEHGYTALRGMISLFSRGVARVKRASYTKRLFKRVADEYLRQKEGRERATGGRSDRDFFCSYFTAHAFQQAELSQNLKEIKQLAGVSGGLKQIGEMFEGRTRTETIRKWAKEMARQHHGTPIVKQFVLDPKYTGPHELFSFLRQKGLFESVLKIVPPTA